MAPFKQTTTHRRRAESIRSMATLLAGCAGAVLLAAAPLRVTAAPAPEAAVGDDGTSVAVRYGDLKVDSERGARVLLERLQFAAGEVCPYAGDRDPERVALRNQCMREAIARAVQQVGSARLAAVYSASANHG